jgi:2-desacetyl-2-hydroxyethyl bacteriochlorophyllide A dehydrogenase
MKQRSVIFQQPYQIEIAEGIVPEPGSGEVLVETACSAISAGTELLVYRGQVPTDLDVDATISALSGTFEYPLKYGYTAVGRVIALGPAVDRYWLGRRVFCFHPHESAFLARPEELLAIPEELDSRDALFLANMETAVNFLMDGRPLIGERVVVIGLGIVGLLTTALLGQFPLAAVIGLDRYPLRRETALRFGAHATVDPQTNNFFEQIRQFLPETEDGGPADLVYEVSGNPQALNTALQIAGFHARVVIGSWYGQKQAAIELGGAFHRSRIQVISSQVSTIAPEFSGRWTKARRLEVAFERIRSLKPADLITHTFTLLQADQAFTLLDTHPEEVLQVVLTY